MQQCDTLPPKKRCVPNIRLLFLPCLRRALETFFLKKIIIIKPKLYRSCLESCLLQFTEKFLSTKTREENRPSKESLSKTLCQGGGARVEKGSVSPDLPAAAGQWLWTRCVVLPGGVLQPKCSLVVLECWFWSEVT